jgi:hypothetical protein
MTSVIEPPTTLIQGFGYHMLNDLHALAEEYAADICCKISIPTFNSVPSPQRLLMSKSNAITAHLSFFKTQPSPAIN